MTVTLRRLCSKGCRSLQLPAPVLCRQVLLLKPALVVQEVAARRDVDHAMLPVHFFHPGRSNEGVRVSHAMPAVNDSAS